MRLSPTIAVAALVITVVAACGGSSPASTTDGLVPDGAAPQTETDAARAPAGVGTVAVVTIGSAAYTSGSAHVEVSGVRQLAFDGQLLTGVSMTTGGTTLLMYPGGEAGVAVFSISNGPDTGLAFTLSAEDLTTGADATTGCAIELTRNDASGLAGQFDCRGLLSVSPDLPTVDVRGTFTAEP